VIGVRDMQKKEKGGGKGGWGRASTPQPMKNGERPKIWFQFVVEFINIRGLAAREVMLKRRREDY